MTDGMFMNSNSSNESYSDDEKCRLQTVDLICSDNKEEEQLKTKNSLTKNRIEHDTRPFWRVNGDNNAHLSQDVNENSRLKKTG